MNFPTRQPRFKTSPKQIKISELLVSVKCFLVIYNLDNLVYTCWIYEVFIIIEEPRNMILQFLEILCNDIIFSMKYFVFFITENFTLRFFEDGQYRLFLIYKVDRMITLTSYFSTLYDYSGLRKDSLCYSDIEQRQESKALVRNYKSTPWCIKERKTQGMRIWILIPRKCSSS